jgi:hypothetical protein
MFVFFSYGVTLSRRVLFVKLGIGGLKRTTLENERVDGDANKNLK